MKSRHQDGRPDENPSTHSGIQPEPTSNGKIRMRSPSSNVITFSKLEKKIMRTSGIFKGFSVVSRLIQFSDFIACEQAYLRENWGKEKKRRGRGVGEGGKGEMSLQG